MFTVIMMLQTKSQIKLKTIMSNVARCIVMNSVVMTNVFYDLCRRYVSYD